ncbi:MAG: hypothetical protein FWG83_00855 [Oscillospiraceae bacterium]|nr:hypothetical protein [Oscillospiraceae bacterium]
MNYSCSRCATSLGADGVCPACGTPHSIPAPQPVQPVQQQQVQPQMQQPMYPQQPPIQPQMQQPMYPQQQVQQPFVPPTPTVQKGDFCQKCGTQLNAMKTCPSGCVIAGSGGGGDFINKTFDVSGEDDAKLVFGQTKVKVPIIIASLGIIATIMYFLPFYFISESFGGQSMSFEVTGAQLTFGVKMLGMKVASGNILTIFHIIIPLALTFAAMLKTNVLQDKVKIQKLNGNYFKALTAISAAGIGALILLAAVGSGNEMLKEMSIGVGYIISMIVYVLSGVISFFCMQKTK